MAVYSEKVPIFGPKTGLTVGKIRVYTKPPVSPPRIPTIASSEPSPADTITAMATEATLTTGQEEFGLRITSSGGSGAVDTVYDDTPANSYALVTSAFPDTIATSSGVSATTTYSLYYAANIGASTEAHTDYSSSLTYIATGNF